MREREGSQRVSPPQSSVACTSSCCVVTLFLRDGMARRVLVAPILGRARGAHGAPQFVSRDPDHGKRHRDPRPQTSPRHQLWGGAIVKLLTREGPSSGPPWSSSDQPKEKQHRNDEVAVDEMLLPQGDKLPVAMNRGTFEKQPMSEKP